MQPTFTLPYFNQLPNAEKYELLEDYGVYLDLYKREGPYKIALFNLAGIYVEVYLDENRDQLVKATAFDSYKGLDPYIKSIDLTPIYCLL